MGAFWSFGKQDQVSASEGASAKEQYLDERMAQLEREHAEKVAALEASGIAVVERLSAEVVPEESFEKYLKTKHEKMGHIVESLVTE